ncbi:hypothetical protein [Sphingomonas sp. LY160]|uniref:hypothetical protein n=1 Tax=Sphingomonas sp. LY160 TaxID=3095342 RepID=UPI002ADEF509|nr:hypothetical protein [Sphingomonas sp. LY160]MEA1073322.1 hypothetical protein [Sphingomonas sp. LY160]
MVEPDISRTCARRKSLQRRAVDIGDLLDGLADLICRSLSPTISIIIKLTQQLSSARGDSTDPNWPSSIS